MFRLGALDGDADRLNILFDAVIDICPRRKEDQCVDSDAYFGNEGRVMPDTGVQNHHGALWDAEDMELLRIFGRRTV